MITVNEEITKQTVIDHMLKDKFYENVLLKFITDEETRNEFRQELWLIILEKKDDQLIDYYKRNALQPIYIGIIKNQLKSKSSPWHRKYRINNTINCSIEQLLEENDIENNAKIIASLLTNNNQFDEQDTFAKVVEDKEFFETKVNYIQTELIKIEEKNPILKRDIDIFKMHFYDEMSYRKISKKLNIPLTSIYNYITNIKELLIKNKNKVK